MGAISTSQIFGLTIRESANDGSDFTNPAADYRRLFLGEDGLLHLRDSAGTVTDIGSGSGSVATDAIWDAAGDLAVGTGANTAAKLTMGAVGGHLSRINGVVAWDSGTSNPGAAAAGDRAWRSDLGLGIYYDGTRWLSMNLYHQAFPPYNSTSEQPFSGTVNATRMAVMHQPDLDWWMVDWVIISRVNTTNTGSAFWNFTLQQFTTSASTITSATSAAHTVDVITRTKVDVDAVLDVSAVKFLQTEESKTSTPGNLDVLLYSLSYRLIVT